MQSNGAISNVWSPNVTRPAPRSTTTACGCWCRAPLYCFTSTASQRNPTNFRTFDRSSIAVLPHGFEYASRRAREIRPGVAASSDERHGIRTVAVDPLGHPCRVDPAAGDREGRLQRAERPPQARVDRLARRARERKPAVDVGIDDRVAPHDAEQRAAPRLHADVAEQEVEKLGASSHPTRSESNEMT